MKNTIRLGSTLAALIAALLPAHAAAQRGDIALVHRLLLEQRMVVTTAAGAERQAALGDRLQHADVVLTGSDTRAALRFTSDGSMLRLNPSSRLVIQAEGERNAVVTTLELEFGELWARVTRREGQQFRVMTPSGVAAVKGTELVVRVDDTGTSIITLEGIVEFSNAAGTIDITAGRVLRIASANDVPQSQPATSQELDATADLSQDDTVDAGERTLIEIPLQDADGRTRTLIIEVPRAALRALLGGGI